MHKHRQELLRSATRRIQRGKKTTGRIVASALGFSVAYYFDPESGGLRRKHLQHTVRGFFGQINNALAPDVADPAVFPSVLRAHPGTGSRPLADRVGAAR
jgi:hypothetical protein